MERRLSAILASDVVGYSRLMGADEAGTLATLNALRADLIDPKAAHHHGRTIKLMGDGALMEFPSAVEAVTFAVEVQREVQARNADIPADRQIVFRIGINVGDVIIEDGDIHGDGVNVAARLEGLADPGGICISGPALEMVDGKIDLAFEDAGEQNLKNIDRPIRVYRWSCEGALVDGSTPAASNIADRPAIAVLPFTNRSDDPEQEYFADGIAEDIIAALAAWHWFPVISRHSTFNYKGLSKSVAQIARELEARYIVEGSVRRVGDRVRVSAQLIDAATDHQIWTERYDRQIQDIFAVQDEITESIAMSLVPELSHVERLKARRKHRDLDVWDMIWRAQSHVFEFTEGENRKAVEWLTKALKSDPESAYAWSMLALAHYKDAILGFSHDRNRSLEQAREAARKAVRLDDRDWLAHAVLGICYVWTERNFDPALDHERSATRLNPSASWTRAFLSCVLEFGGSPEAAVEELQTALRLDPQSPFATFFEADLAICYFLIGDFDQAAQHARKALDINPTNVRARQRLVATLAEAGKLDEAKVEMESLLRRQPDFCLAYVRETYPFRHREDEERFIGSLRKAGLPD